MTTAELIAREQRAALLADVDARRAMAEGDVLTAEDRRREAHEHRDVAEYLSHRGDAGPHRN